MMQQSSLPLPPDHEVVNLVIRDVPSLQNAQKRYEVLLLLPGKFVGQD